MKQDVPFGASFCDPYLVSQMEIERILKILNNYESFDIIYGSDDFSVFRAFQQTLRKPMMAFNVSFIAENNNDTDYYLITDGTIRTSSYVKEQEYEKVGKRLLYRAMKERWEAKF